MDFIPAIDLKGGCCVRLKQGDINAVTQFSKDPVAMALHWVAAGAKRLHIIDLDGAFSGEPVHLSLIESIIKAVPDEVKIQVGGGLRSLETLDRYLQAGAHRLILGTKAVKEPEFLQKAADKFSGTLVYGLDLRNGEAAVSGWVETAKFSMDELMQSLKTLPLAAILYTDISKDGMMTGANIKETLALAKISPVPIIASGGIAHLKDVAQLLKAQQQEQVDLDGLVVGRGLYEGRLDCTEAVALCQN